MLKIQGVASLSDLQSEILRERAQLGNCAKSEEFVAFVGTVEAGLLSFENWTATKLGFIYEIFVLPPFRRQRIGSSLLSFAEDHALKLGCKSIRLKPYSLDCELDQNRLIAWYESAGYCRTSDDPESMEKTLDAQSTV